MPESLIFEVIPISKLGTRGGTRYAKGVIQVFLTCLLSLLAERTICLKFKPTCVQSQINNTAYYEAVCYRSAYAGQTDFFFASRKSSDARNSDRPCQRYGVRHYYFLLKFTARRFRLLTRAGPSVRVRNMSKLMSA